MDGGAWWAAVHGVAKSQTRLSDFPFTFHFHALEKEMATHSSVLAWRIPGMAEPGGLLSMGSHRVGHDWSDLAAAAAAYTHGGLSWWLRWKRICLQFRRPSFDPWVGRSPGKGNGYPLHIYYLENSTDRGAWQTRVHGVTELDTTEWLTLSFHFYTHKHTRKFM